MSGKNVELHFLRRGTHPDKNRKSNHFSSHQQSFEEPHSIRRAKVTV